jgi:hypothetical protein
VRVLYGTPLDPPGDEVPRREAGRILTERLMEEIGRLESELARA